MTCQDCGVGEGERHRINCPSYRVSANVPWAGWRDTPLLTFERIEVLRLGIKVICPTDSGKNWTLVRYDDVSPYQRCNELRSIASQICFAQKGHELADIPHLPMAEELDDKYGFKLVAIEYGMRGVDAEKKEPDAQE
jgi:hypothetical protein